MTAILAIWTIYERPLDYPTSFVARRFDVAAGTTTATSDVLLGATLEEVRELLPPGLHNLGREPLDEPQIIESWV